MTGFDRAALVARAEKQKRGKQLFWIVIAALPVIGAGAGLALSWSPAAPRPVALMAETEAERLPPIETAAVADTATVPASPETRGYSASDELDRYLMTVTTLRACAQGGLREHYMKALDTYTSTNSHKADQLRQLALVEERDDLSAFEKEMPTDPARIMFEGMTGQLAMNALQRQSQFQSMMSSVEKRATGYLGKEPGGAECTQFRTNVMMGKYTPKLPKS